MAYSKQTWDTNSIFNPTRMNHIEQGIYDVPVVKYKDLTLQSAVTVSANSSASTSLSEAVPSKAISANLLNYSSSGINAVFSVITRWQNTLYIDLINPTTSSKTIPQGMTIRVFYIE